MTAKLEFPYTQIPDPNRGGRVLFNASIYIGLPDTNPTIPANQLRVYYIDENESEINISQPVRTGVAGLPVNSNGDEIDVRIDTTSTTYSILIQDSNGTQRYYDQNAISVLATPSASSVQTENNGSVQDYIDTQTFKTVADMKSFDYTGIPENTKIEWLGYYEQSDGGGNCGVLKTGTHTDDGGSIFSINGNTYIEADLKGEKINLLKFGIRTTSADNAQFIQNAANYLTSSGEGRTLELNDADGNYRISTVTLNSISLVGDGTLEKLSTATHGLILLGSDVSICGIRFRPQETTGQPNSDIKLGDGLDRCLIDKCNFSTERDSTIYSAIASADDPIAEPDGDFPYTTNVRDLVINECSFNGYTRPVYLYCIDGYTISSNVFRNTDFDAIRIREIIGEGNIVHNAFYDIGDPTYPDEQSRDCIDTAWSGFKLNIIGNMCKRIAYVGIDIKGTPTSSFGYGSELINVRDNFVSDTRYSAYSFAGRGFFNCVNNVAERFNIEDASVGDAGFLVKGDDNPENFNFEGCIAKEGNGRGFFIETGCSEFTVRSCRALNNKDSGVHIGNCSDYILDDVTSSIVSELSNTTAQTFGLTLTASSTSTRTATITNCKFLNNTGRQVRINGSGFTQNILKVWANNDERGNNAYNTDTSLGRLLAMQERILFTNGVAPSANDGENQRGDIHFYNRTVNSRFIGRVCVTTGDGSSAVFERFGPKEKNINTTFTTSDGKTVTIVDGFIDSIV